MGSAVATIVKILAKPRKGVSEGEAAPRQKVSYKAVIRMSGWPTVCMSFRLKEEAKNWARKTEDEMVRGMYVHRTASESQILSKALDRYAREVTPTKKPSSQATELRRIELLKQQLGAYSLRALTADVVAKYRDDRLEGDIDPKTKRRKPRAANTVRLELALLSHLFTIAIKEWRDGLVYNPVQNIRKPSPGPGRNRRLSADEEAKLLARVDGHSNPMLRWIVRIALETGMRSSEITSLRRSQVDIQRRIVRLLETKNTSPRTVPLTIAAATLFDEALHHPVRPIDTDLIFFGEPGRDGIRRPYEFNKVWTGMKAEVGIKDFRFHDLRHEAVSRFVEAGLGDQEVAAISGHKSMQMLKRYTHLRAEDLVSRLDELTASRRDRARSRKA